MKEDSKLAAGSIPWELLGSYFSRDCSPEEQLEAEAWIAGHPEFASEVELFRMAWESVSTPIYEDVNVVGVEREVLARIGGTSQRKAATAYSPKSLPRWVGYAVIATVLMGFVGWQAFQSFGRESTPDKHVTYSTRAGQRATVRLSEGTTIVLGPSTILRVAGRTVDMTGEAMFTVSHGLSSPFVVKTKDAETQVLGTVFGVRKYDGEATRVAVTDGKISVNSAVLSAGDIAIADKNRVVRVKHDAEFAIRALAFAQGRLVFDAEPLGHAAAQISRWLGMDVRIDSDVATRLLSATITDFDSPAIILDEIAQLTGTQYNRNGRIATFTPRHASK